MIKTESLVKRYKNDHIEVEVIKDINLRIKKHEFVSIMGPSGSGKSTLLYLIGGLEKPTSGKVIIGDVEVNDLNDREHSLLRQENIGFVFQFYNLVPHLSVSDNILLPILINGGRKKDYIKRLDYLLEKVGLTEKRDYLPSRLSGGQQQRISIARALINNPKIILADEPIGNLDSKAGKEVMELFKQINETEGTTIVQVTHSSESAKYGSRTIFVKDGRIST